MEQIFLDFVNMSITASYVIVAVLLARVLMVRLPKKYSYWLWSIVGVRLMCPLSISSVFSIFNLGKFKEIASPAGQMTYVPDNIGLMAKPEVNVGVTSVNTVINQVLPAPQTEMVTSVNPMQVWLFVGAWVWLIGIAVILVWGMASYIKARKMVKKAVIYSGNHHGVSEKIKIYECDNIGSPFVLGVIVPRIYIPFRMSEAELNYILQHEFYHIRRRDYLTKLLAFMLTAVYWFNPLVWAAYFFFNRDMEMSCDEKVLSMLGGTVKKDYSSLLLAFATNKRIGFGMLAFGEGDISKRVKNVLNFKNPKLWMGIAGIILVIVLAVCCLTNAKEDEAPVVMPTGQTVYKMVTENEDLFWTPGITLDSDEGTFTFGYSMLSSYINYGSYEIQGDKLIAKTSDGQYYFTFRVVDEETLEFVEKESSKLNQFEDEKEFWVKDGAIFKCSVMKSPVVNEETTGTGVLPPDPEFGFEVQSIGKEYRFDTISQMNLPFDMDIFLGGDAMVTCDGDNNANQTEIELFGSGKNTKLSITVWENGKESEMTVNMSSTTEKYGTTLYGHKHFSDNYQEFMFTVNDKEYYIETDLLEDDLTKVMAGILDNNFSGNDFDLSLGKAKYHYYGKITPSESTTLGTFAGMIPTEQIGSLVASPECEYSGTYSGTTAMLEKVYLTYRNETSAHVSLNYYYVAGGIATAIDKSEIIPLEELSWERVKKFEHAALGLNQAHKGYRFSIGCGEYYIQIYAECLPEDMKKMVDVYLKMAENNQVIGEHLQFFDSFEWENQNGGMNGFMLSEKKVDGVVFYCLKEEAKNVEILVDAECKSARVITGKIDKTIDLPVRVHFGGTNDGGYFHLFDATGDGTAELVYVYGGGGTGAWSGGVDIYNMADMTKYAIEDESDMIYQIESSVDVELLYMDGDKSALCKITEPDETVSVIRMTAWGDKAVKLDDFAIEPDGETGYIAYDVSDASVYGREGLTISVGIDMSDVCMPGSYLGNVEYWLVYDEKDNIFRLGDYVWSDFSHYGNTVGLEIRGYSGKGLPQSEKEWIIEFTNKLETVDISYLHDVTFQKLSENGEWEEVVSTNGICGMMDLLKAGETVEIAVRPEWFPDMEPGRYQMGVLYSIEVGENEYENLWYYESVEIFE